MLPDRHGSSEKYRYAFNGKEKDDEVKGEGLQYDYGFRIYDPRIGKFLSQDPLFKSFPWYTPYQFAGNKPIWAIDLDGLEDYIPLPDAKQYTISKLGKSNEPTIPCVTCHHNTVLDSSLLTDDDLREAENLKIGALVVVTIATGGIAYEAYAGGALTQGFFRLAWMASNPALQETGVGIVGLTASMIDPDPLADYPGSFDDAAKGFKYLFRGTSRGFQGGTTAVRYSATYTSTDPLKSTLFSELSKAKGEAVLLLGHIDDLKDVPMLPSNSLAEMEKELILNIKPSVFFEKTKSITLSQARSIFKEMNIEVPTNVTLGNINEKLKSIKDLTDEQIETFYNKAIEVIKQSEQKKFDDVLNFIKTLDKPK